MCRDDNLQEQVLTELRQSFRSIASYKLEEDVNEILYCRNDDVVEGVPVRQVFEKSLKNFDMAAKNLNSWTKNHNISCDDFLNELKW